MGEIERLYAIVGGNESMTDEELYNAYVQLRTQYQNDRFLEGEAGNIAAEKLTELNEAYTVLCDYRKNKERGADSSFSKIDALLKDGKINEAQAALDEIDERTAEWHYLQSVVFYKKNWTNESKKQLEIAIEMDGSVEKYKKAYDRLCNQMNFNNTGDGQKKKYDTDKGNYSESGNPETMMGGDSCLEVCCRSIICTAALNCCCNPRC